MCVHACVFKNGDEMDNPSTDEAEDKQTEPRFWVRRLFIGSAGTEPQASGTIGATIETETKQWRGQDLD